MAEYHSGSSLRRHPIRDLLWPTNIAWLLYTLISIIVLVFVNITSLWEFLLGEPLSAQDVGPLTDKFSAFQDRLGTPIVMVFWLFIGAITYTLFWLTENVFFIAKTEVEESKYISRNPSSQQSYWQSAITSNFFLVFIVLLWLTFIALYLRLLLPIFSDEFNDSLFNGSAYQRLLSGLTAIAGNTLVIYLILLIRRVITFVWQVNRP